MTACSAKKAAGVIPGVPEEAQESYVGRSPWPYIALSTREANGARSWTRLKRGAVSVVRHTIRATVAMQRSIQCSREGKLQRTWNEAQHAFWAKIFRKHAEMGGGMGHGKRGREGDAVREVDNDMPRVPSPSKCRRARLDAERSTSYTAWSSRTSRGAAAKPTPRDAPIRLSPSKGCFGHITSAGGARGASYISYVAPHKAFHAIHGARSSWT
ncbi:hypothetical protein C8J57DRAFT_1248526 [Mycena rebaudengoi]|nr:hypothetical protein C8J57DRAFT_1248526 [Mycena rebaudengoi]